MRGWFTFGVWLAVGAAVLFVAPQSFAQERVERGRIVILSDDISNQTRQIEHSTTSPESEPAHGRSASGSSILGRRAQDAAGGGAPPASPTLGTGSSRGGSSRAEPTRPSGRSDPQGQDEGSSSGPGSDTSDEAGDRDTDDESGGDSDSDSEGESDSDNDSDSDSDGDSDSDSDSGRSRGKKKGHYKDNGGRGTPASHSNGRGRQP